MKLLLLALLSCLTLVNGVIRVRFGTVNIQMRSESASDSVDLVSKVLVQIVSFLTDVYRDEYSNFDQVQFSVSDYDLSTDWTGGYLGSISVKGTLAFNETVDSRIPSPFHVAEITSQAFKAYDQEFLENLGTISDNDFLRDISYAVLSVNGEPTSSVSGAPAADIDDKKGLEVWAIAVIAGAATFVIVCCVCFIWFCYYSGDDEEVDDAVVRNAISKGTATASEDISINGNISPTPSITSQASSKFTYNPSSARGHRPNSFNVDDPSEEGRSLDSLKFDVSKWTREANSQLPTRKDEASISFGQDISGIPNVKDLSLIEESPDEDATPQKGNISNLSQSTLDGMEMGTARHVPPSLLDHTDDSYLDVTNGSTSDVIQELNDLSYQISKLRGR